MAYLDVRGLCESDLYKVHIFERLLVCLGYSFKWLHGSGGGRFSFVNWHLFRSPYDLVIVLVFIMCNLIWFITSHRQYVIMYKWKKNIFITLRVKYWYTVSHLRYRHKIHLIYIMHEYFNWNKRKNIKDEYKNPYNAKVVNYLN